MEYINLGMEIFMLASLKMIKLMAMEVILGITLMSVAEASSAKTKSFILMKSLNYHKNNKVR